MTNIEVVKELKSVNKIYRQIKPEIKQSVFSLTCSKIVNGMCKPETVRQFFLRFGYVGDWNNFEKKQL